MNAHESARNFSCAACSSTFTRLACLQRHQLSHESHRPWRCEFCNRSFNRRDALSRHAQTCRSRLSSGSPVPTLARARRGKKRRACKRCHRLKRACNFAVPCEACEEKALECSYASLRDVDVDSPGGQGQAAGPTELDGSTPVATESNEVSGRQSLIDTDQSEIAHALALEMLADHSAPDAGSTVSSFQLTLNPWLHEHAETFLVSSKKALVNNLPFLLTFTSSTGFVESFECGSIIDRTLIQSAYLSRLEDSTAAYSVEPAVADFPSSYPEHDAFACNDRALAFLLSGVPWPGWESGFYALGATDNSFVDQEALYSSTPNGPPQAEIDALSAISADIVTTLRMTLSSNYERRITAWSTSCERDSVRFFSPFNLGRFLALFWSSWYPNCPIVHRPTFRASAAASELVAAMVVIGACLSPDDGDRVAARMWFEGVQQMVFGRGDFSEDFVVAVNEDAEFCYRRLQALQAAYFVCLYQSWEGSKLSRQRARRQRYTQVIALSRSLLPHCNSQCAHRNPEESESGWQHFIVCEQLIRTVTYVFLLDCGYAIFHNTPPRMSTSELSIPLTCHESLFQAPSATSFIQQVHHLKSISIVAAHTARMPLNIAIANICAPQLSTAAIGMFAGMTTLNLFAIASAFHSLIHHLNTLPQGAGGPASTTVMNGLKNWRTVWAARMHLATVDDENERAEAAMGAAEQAWSKVGFMRHAPEFWQLACIMVRKAGWGGVAGSVGAVETLVEENKGAEGQEELYGYDETDMGHIHRLIRRFQVHSVCSEADGYFRGS